MSKKTALFIVLIWALCGAQSPARESVNRPEVNFTYLETQRMRVKIPGGSEGSLWATAGAKKSDGSFEYSFVTEDIARICLLYCASYEKLHDTSSMEKIKDALTYLLAMQSNEGFFRKGLKADGTPDGTQEARADLSSANAFWALSRSRRILAKDDPSYAAKLDGPVEKVISQLEAAFAKPGKGYRETITLHGKEMPAWLINGESDTTSVFILGLMEHYQLHQDAAVKDLISRLCDAVSSFSGTNYEEFPFCGHYESVADFNLWTLSHNRQMAALSRAGAQFGQQAWIESAEREANGLYTHFIASYGPLPGMAPGPVIFPQESAGVQVMAENLASLARATKKEHYSLMAGLAASWLFGNNTKKEIMYDKSTGMAWRSLNEKGKSPDGSARASAEALMTLIELWNTAAMQQLHTTEKYPPHTFKVLEAEDGKAVRKDYDVEDRLYPGGATGKNVVIKRENSFWIKFETQEENTYDFYLVYLKQPGLDMGSSIMMRIDGDRIFTVPLGGSPDTPYITMKEVLEPRVLLPGLHSLGIRYSGLLHTNPTILDAVILQPSVEWRIFSDPAGHSLVFIKSFFRVDLEFPTNSLTQKNLLITSFTTYTKTGVTASSVTGLQATPAKIRIPEHGYAILRGR
ncbi:MAG: hypothetical protein RDV48_13610 [Candidatus Eremiobacteraeota bacterium]|nr:hypothetical protein [Candidatus Eremiobacteraeota bacterium]